MKVLIVDTAIAFGGTLIVARNLLTHLDPRLIDASMVSACTDGFVTADFAGGSAVRFLAPAVDYVTLQKWKAAAGKAVKSRSLRWLLGRLVIAVGILGNVYYMVRLGRICVKLGIEVIHVNNYTAEPLWTAHLLRIPVIYHLHGYLPARLERSARASFRPVKVFVAVSRAVAASAVRAGIRHDRIRVIPNFVERLSESAPLLPAELAIGIFGRVTQWKGQREFLIAVLEVLPKFPELRVYVVGDASDGDPAYMAECRALVAASAFPHQIEFTGRVSDVESYYRRCTVVVHASVEPEPFGMVLIEAMAQARPVVASVLGAAPEIIEQGVEGFLVDPNDSAALAARIEELLDNRALASRMGLSGYQKVRVLYEPLNATRQFEGLYTEIARATVVSRDAT